MRGDADQVGAIGAVTRLGQALIGALPPAFLLLCLINLVFLGMMVWFLERQGEARVQLIERIIDRCVDLPDRPWPKP